MELRFEHRIGRPLDVVERTLLDPGFSRRLWREGTLLAGGEELSRRESAETVERSAHFVVRGVLPYLGRFGKVGWREVVSYDRAAHAAKFEVMPDMPSALASRTRCNGTYRLSPQGPGTARIVEASITVDVPLVRTEIETRIANLLTALFEHEAKVLCR
jgi:Protein of unknown function (DUF2505)